MVPDPAARVSDSPRPPRQPHVFERSDFDEIFRPLSGSPRASVDAVPHSAAPASTPPQPDAGVEKTHADKLVTFHPTASQVGRRERLAPWGLPRFVMIAVLALSLAFIIGFMAGMFVERLGQARQTAAPAAVSR
jgi:hypothetical protein